MTAERTESGRCAQLTDAGLKRLHEARRKYRKTIENIVYAENTPSLNTIKRALRQGPVFLDTLERIWDYLRACAEERQDVLPDLLRDEDYVFVEMSAKSGRQHLEAQQAKGETGENSKTANQRSAGKKLEAGSQNLRGWISRQVPPPNRLFMEREFALVRLRAALQADAVLPSDAQALTGMGGIGKTQTAVAYIYKHRNDYCGVFWIHAETVEALNDGLASLAQEMRLLGDTVVTKKSAVQTMHDWLLHNSDWLLVLDNADDLVLLAPHFPRCHNGSLLLTTRAANTARWANSVEIVPFEREAGALLLLRAAGILTLARTLDDVAVTVAVAARELSDEVDGLPLALDQAGAYLAETAVTVPKYLARYRRRGVDLLDKHPSRAHPPVAVTFELALEQVVKRHHYGPAAAQLIRLCAFLAPDVIPEAIFAACAFLYDGRQAAPLPLSAEGAASETAGQARNKYQARSHQQEDDYAEIIAAACRYSLLRRDANNQTLSIHRLVQKVVRDSLPHDQHRSWIMQAVRAVADATPDFEFDDWPLCELLLPHWRLCADYIRDHEIETPAAAYLVYQAGRYLRVRAEYEEAEILLRLCVHMAQKVHGEKHRTTAEYQDALACLYRDLARYSEAETLHLRALQTSEETAGPEHAETAGKLHNIALLYMERQEYDRAEACFLRTLAIREKQPIPEPRLMAAAMTQLAGVYRYQKCYVRAEPYSRRALSLYEALPEPDHTDIATACNNLALLCVDLKQYAEAEALCLRAVKINEERRGREHPETGTAYWTLAMAQWKWGRMTEAEESFARALRIYTRNFDPEHARVTRLLDYYADFKRDAGMTA